MSKRLLLTVFAVFVFSLVFGNAVYSQSKENLLGQLNQAKKDYYAAKYEIDNQVRILSRDWHINQLEMYAKIKQNPDQSKAIRAEIWEGAKELSSNKKALFDQLTPLRKEWYKNRMELEAQIADIEAAEAAERD